MTTLTTLQNMAKTAGIFSICNGIGKAVRSQGTDLFGRVYSKPIDTLTQAAGSFSNDLPFTASWGAATILTDFAMSKMSCFKSLPDPARTSVAFVATFLATALASEQVGINLPPQETLAIFEQVTVVILPFFLSISISNSRNSPQDNRNSQKPAAISNSQLSLSSKSGNSANSNPNSRPNTPPPTQNKDQAGAIVPKQTSSTNSIPKPGNGNPKETNNKPSQNGTKTPPREDETRSGPVGNLFNDPSSFSPAAHNQSGKEQSS